jgi:hypothetical protein
VAMTIKTGDFLLDLFCSGLRTEICFDDTISPLALLLPRRLDSGVDRLTRLPFTLKLRLDRSLSFPIEPTVHHHQSLRYENNGPEQYFEMKNMAKNI